MKLEMSRKEGSARTFMIIEHFRTEHVKTLYDKLEKEGRLLPDGVVYIDSWIDWDFKTCYQVMQAPSVEILHSWTKLWEEFATFEIVPVYTSSEAQLIRKTDHS